MFIDSLIDAKSLLFIAGMLSCFLVVGEFKKSSLRLLWEVSLPVGLLGFLMGVVSMLAAVADLSGVAPAMAVAMMTLLYSGLVRVLLSDTHDQPLVVDASIAVRLAGSAGLSAILGWVMVSLIPDGADAFLFPQVLMLLAAGVLLLLVVGRYLSDVVSNGWARKLLGLAWLGFLAGLVNALPHLNEPKLLGPSMAFALLSLLYGIAGTLFGLIWVPDRMTDRDGSLPFGPLLAASVVLAVVAFMGLLFIAIG